MGLTRLVEPISWIEDTTRLQPCNVSLPCLPDWMCFSIERYLFEV